MGNKHSRSTAFFVQETEGLGEPVVSVGKRGRFVPQENLPAKYPSPEDICLLCEEALATNDEEIAELAREVMEASRSDLKVVVHVVNIHPVALDALTQARPICCGRR